LCAAAEFETLGNNLSIWAVQRDNGGCPGSTGSNDCSGIVQDIWDFSNVLNPFSGL
jgi:hypothetical protein